MADVPTSAKMKVKQTPNLKKNKYLFNQLQSYENKTFGIRQTMSKT